MRPTVQLSAVLMAATAVLAGCGDSDDGVVQGDAPSTGDGEATVTIGSMSFSPSEIEIEAGDTVAWRWDDEWEDEGIPHNVSFDEGPSSPTQRDGTWQRTFDQAGSYEYTCTLHPNMTGAVTVR